MPDVLGAGARLAARARLREPVHTLVLPAVCPLTQRAWDAISRSKATSIVGVNPQRSNRHTKRCSDQTSTDTRHDQFTRSSYMCESVEGKIKGRERERKGGREGDKGR